MVRRQGFFHHKSICFILFLCIMIEMISGGVMGYAESISQKITASAVVDVVTGEAYIFGSITTGAEKPVFIYVLDPNSKEILIRQILSQYGGVFTTSFKMPADAVNGSYIVKVGAEGLSPVETRFNYTPSENPIKITGTATDHVVLMKTATEVDSVKNSFTVKIINGSVRTGKMVQNVDFEIGEVKVNADKTVELLPLPSGLSATAVGNAGSNTIDFTLNGTATESITANKSLGVILRVSTVENVQTKSDVIEGITLMEYVKAGKIYASLDSGDNDIGMISPLQVDPANRTFSVQLGYNRKPSKANLSISYMTTGASPTPDCIVTGLPSGMLLIASGDYSNGKIVFSVKSDTNPSSAITSNKAFSVLIRKSAVEGASADADAITVPIQGASDSTKSSGGGGGPTLPSVTSTPAPLLSPSPLPSEAPVPTQAPSPTPGFSDLPSSPAHWARADILWMLSKGYVNGNTEGTFHPDSKITRAQFVTMVDRIFKIPNKEYASTFSDVSTTDWFANYVQAAADAGIIASAGGDFRPNDPLTREEMTKIIIKAYTLQKNTAIEVASIDEFDDKDQISSWATEYVQKAIGLGIVNGMTTVTFEPKLNATRAQAVVILRRLLNVMQ